MSMHVIGYMPADEQWNKMKAAWDACTAAAVDPPKEVFAFFDYTPPGDAPGKEVKIDGVGAREWKDQSREGYEVDVTALPKGVRFVRFYCSW